MKNGLLFALSLLTVFLGLFTLQQRFRLSNSRPLRPFDLSDSTHRLETFFLVYLFRAIEPELILSTKTLRAFPRERSRATALRRVSPRRNYCLANFLQFSLNALPSEALLFLDAKGPLKRSLGIEFGLVNTRLCSNCKAEQNWEWNPRAGVLFAAADLTTFNSVGRTLLGAFQATNNAPGAAAAHRFDRLLDAGRDDALAERFPRNYRLYVEGECRAFFAYLQSREFRQRARTETLFRVFDAETGDEEPLDFVRTHRLRRQFQRGTLCGKLRRRLVALAHASETLHFSNGQTVTLRLFLHFASTAPTLVYLHEGVALTRGIDGGRSVLSAAAFAERVAAERLGDEVALAALRIELRSIAAAVAKLVAPRLLADPRFFHTAALDFALLPGLRPLLVGTSASVPLRRAYEPIHRALLGLQLDVLQRRNERVHAFVREAVHRLNKRFAARRPLTFEAALVAMESGAPPRALRQQFRAVFRNSPPRSLPSEIKALIDGAEDESLKPIIQFS